MAEAKSDARTEPEVTCLHMAGNAEARLDERTRRAKMGLGFGIQSCFAPRLLARRGLGKVLGGSTWVLVYVSLNYRGSPHGRGHVLHNGGCNPATTNPDLKPNIKPGLGLGECPATPVRSQTCVDE